MTIETVSSTRSLRNLYFTRTAVQLVWAIAVIGLAAKNSALAATLFVLYPLWDVACTLYDLKRTQGVESPTPRYVNVAIGLLAAMGIGLTAFTQPIYAVAIFGAWALLAGLFQLVVGVQRRRKVDGQWAMILSGAQSLIAGVAYVIGGLADKRHLKDVAGYAIFGAVYFLIGGILLGKKREA